jgi:hypothetical protein
VNGKAEDGNDGSDDDRQRLWVRFSMAWLGGMLVFAMALLLRMIGFLD